VDPELDIGRLSELEELLGAERSVIARTLVTELTAAVRQIDAGLERRDLDEVAAAAHAARNSALMIDAQPLLRVLRQLETCARGEDATGAGEARAGVARVWPRLRRELEAAAG
jgi:HPt (histidine-containing phosphotransfer) domain-containing protein